MENIISNCPLCEEHSLHVVGENDLQIHQCINCGYVSSPKYVGTKKTNGEYQKLTDDMKKWAVEVNGRIWIPTMMTLPTAMLYPVEGDDGVMEWAYAPIVDIPEENRKEYPKPNGGYYDKTYDVDNPIIYKVFMEAMLFINKNAKISNGSEKTTL